jgi:hypothetical protein
MNSMRIMVRLILLIGLSVSTGSQLRAQTLTVRQAMAEPSVAGMRTEGERISPDGTKVIYLWNPDGRFPKHLYLQSTSGGPATRILSPADLPPPSRPPERENKLNYGVDIRDEFVRERENQLGGFEWSPDSRRLLFTHGGDLYVLSLGDNKPPRRLTKTQSGEVGARFLDSDRILFSQNGHVFVWNIVDSALIQLTREANPTNFISVGSVTPNKQGSMLAYVVSDASKQRQYVVPNFLGEFVTGSGPRRGWTESKLWVTDGIRENPTEIKLPSHEGVMTFRRLIWAPNGKDLIVDRLDRDTKRRMLFYVRNAGEKDEKVITVDDDTDPKWQASLSVIFEPHPVNAGELFFGSERDGYNHLYLARVTGDKAEVTQLTRGNWQVEWARWSPANDGIIFMSTLKGPATRTISRVNPSGEIVTDAATERLSGMIESPQMGSETREPVVVFGFSRWNMPTEVYWRHSRSGREEDPGKDLLAAGSQPGTKIPDGDLRSWCWLFAERYQRLEQLLSRVHVQPHPCPERLRGARHRLSRIGWLRTRLADRCLRLFGRQRL